MIHQVSGWWWPMSDQTARPIIVRDAEPDIAAFLRHVPGRQCIVQAGGNVGIYPLALADHFRAVWTVEPDPENFACLERNIAARDSLRRVHAEQAAFGAEAGSCRVVEVHPGNCGAHRIAEGGAIRVITIDSLGLDECDAIWLDCEGSETFALRGAEQTIRRFGPVICAEDKGLDRQFFNSHAGALQAYLGDLGYQQVAAIGRDKVFRRMAP